MIFPRRLRAVLTIGLLWGLAWSVVGAFLGLREWLSFRDPDPALTDALQALSSGGIVWAALGAVSGTVFSAIFTFAERQRTPGDLSLGRMVLWGTVATLWLPVLATGIIWALEGVGVPRLPWWIWPYIALGAASAAATFLLARQGSVSGPQIAGVLGVATAVGAFVLIRDARETPAEPWLLRRQLRAEAVGCYSLFTARGRRIDSTFYNASPVVRLDSANSHLENNDQWGRRMHALDTLGNPNRTTRGSLTRWFADSLTDTVRLSFSTGFSGAAFAFAVPAESADTLRGRIVEYWDFTDPTDRGRAYAVRTACIAADTAAIAEASARPRSPSS